MLDINIEDNKSGLEKITINSKSVNVQANFTTIKCYQSLPNITSLEARGINIIKIHKTVYLNISNLIHVDLRENMLIKISKNFKLFKNLQTLRLDNNQITYVPSFIREFSKLEEFTISNNRLTSIPSSIQYLTSLKIFKFSNNKIEKIPIEFGLLKGLKILYMDGNHFTEIPTTLCYLRYLEEICFEWFEFVDPPLYKVLKENIGRSFIDIVRNTLQEMIKSSVLYCDFNTFVEKISSSKINKSNDKSNDKAQPDKNASNSSASNLQTLPNKNGVTPPSFFTNPNLNGITTNKFLKIFSAIENGYYGVVKALLNSSEEYFTIKNSENKTPFYIAIYSKNDDLISLFLSKIDLSKIPSSHVYLHRAIRSRNPELVKKLVKMGININSVDDQGCGCFHVLFYTFLKQCTRCALIADFLLENGAPINTYNNENWAPIHIAARKGNKECLLWILSSNKKLKAEGKEQFDLNSPGKNKWTPLHLTVNSYKYEETLILLENGCNVFARENSNKTPKGVCGGNNLLNKLLTSFENSVMYKKYKDFPEDKNECVRCYTTVDGDEEELQNLSRKKEEIGRPKTNIIGREQFEGEPKIPKSQTYKNFQNFSNNIGTYRRDTLFSTMTGNHLKKDVPSKVSKKDAINSLKNYTTSSSNFLNSFKINEAKTFTSKNLKEINQNILSELDYSENSNITKEGARDYETLHYKRDIMLSTDTSLYEKYESFMTLKLSKYYLRFYIKAIIENLDLDNMMNVVLLSDICEYAVQNANTELIPMLSQLQENFPSKKKIPYILKELSNTHQILEVFKKKDFDKLPLFNRANEKHDAPSIKIKKGVKIERQNGEEFNEMFFNNPNEIEDDMYINEMLNESAGERGAEGINETFKKRKAPGTETISNFHSMDIEHPLGYFRQESIPNEFGN